MNATTYNAQQFCRVCLQYISISWWCIVPISQLSKGDPILNKYKDYSNSQPTLPTRVSDPVPDKQDCVVRWQLWQYMHETAVTLYSLQLVVWNRWARYLNTSKHSFKQSLNKWYLPRLVWNRKACLSTRFLSGWEEVPRLKEL